MASSQVKRRARRKGAKTTRLSGRLVTVAEPSSAAADAFRTLAARLILQVDKLPKVVVITSPGYAEGKTTVCANLGVALAQAGKNTLIVDCDLRNPMMHAVFGLHNTQGMADILAKEHRLREVCQEPLPGLKVLATGTPPLDVAQLSNPGRLSDFLAEARQEFDYVLVDAPAVGSTPGAAIIAALGDGVLLTLDARRTRKEQAQQAVHDLRSVGANVLGTVMSNLKGSKDGYYRG